MSHLIKKHKDILAQKNGIFLFMSKIVLYITTIAPYISYI